MGARLTCLHAVLWADARRNTRETPGTLPGNGWRL